MAQKALSFDGTDDYVTIPHAASIEFADEDFTVELWIKATEADLEHGDNLFLKGSFGAPQTGKRYAVSVDVVSDFLNFAIDDDATKSEVHYDDLTNWADGEWHYFAFRRNTTTNKIEICTDGSQVAQDDDNTGSIANGETLYIGANLFGTSDIKAVIDEVRISRKYRTDAEILATWNGGLGKRFEVDGDTEALWHMDEGADSTIYDETANNNDGTITGASWVDGFPFPIAPSAIPSAEAFGTPTVTIGFTLYPTAIASVEAFGNLVIAGPLIVPGIGSQEALGSLTVTPGGVSVAPSGISSEELFGLPKLNLTLSPSAIPSEEIFGALLIVPGGITVLLTAIASAEAFGTATVKMILVIRPSGLVSVEAFGSPLLIVILVGGDGLRLPTAQGQVSIPSGEVSIPSKEVSI